MPRNYIIAADSSANLYRGDCADFAPVPLKILAGEKEYVDDETLDVAGMLAETIWESYPDCDIRIGVNRGLCSYYAEKGGVLVGFES